MSGSFSFRVDDSYINNAKHVLFGASSSIRQIHSAASTIVARAGNVNKNVFKNGGPLDADTAIDQYCSSAWRDTQWIVRAVPPSRCVWPTPAISPTRGSNKG